MSQVSVPISRSLVRTLQFIDRLSAEYIKKIIKPELPDIRHYGDGPRVFCFCATIEGKPRYFFVEKSTGQISVALEDPGPFEDKCEVVKIQ